MIQNQKYLFLGKDNVSEREINTILKQLRKEDSKVLESDVVPASEWVRKIMRLALTYCDVSSAEVGNVVSKFNDK